MANPYLSASGLSLGYQDVATVRDVSFSLAQGDVLAVVGHNGSGKSTLIKTLLGYLPPVSGGFDWSVGKPETIAYLGQQSEFDNRFPIRVRDLAAMGAWSGLGFFGRLTRAHQMRIDEALERTGTTEIADMPLHKLSAGQLQRALFARAMVQDASLILLDEPFTAVDQTTEGSLLELIDDWAGEGRSIIIVLHDLYAVLQHCTHVLLLGNGKAQFGKPADILTPASLVDFGYLTQGQAAWMDAIASGQGSNHV